MANLFMKKYQCPDCKRFWTRKVETCLHCLKATIVSEVTEDPSTLLVATTVTIPSLLAPNPPYTLTLTETPTGEKILKRK